MAQAVEQRHASRQQKHHLDGAHGDVQQVQNSRRVPESGHDLTHGGTGHLGPHDMHVAVVLGRHDGHHKDDDAHTADPVGKAPPEQHALA